MSGLVLNVSADTAKLATMEQALDRLERLLKNPTIADLSKLTTQVKDLDTKSISTSSAVAKLEKTVKTLAHSSKAVVKDTAVLDKNLKQLANGAGNAEVKVNLLTASYSTFSKSAAGSNAELIKTSALLRKQGEATTNLLGKMGKVSVALRQQMADEQAQLGIVTAADKEMALRIGLTTSMVAAKSGLIATLKAETLETAKLALAEGAITKARYNEIAGIAKEAAAVNLLTTSHSEFVAALFAANKGIFDFTAGLKSQSASARALLVSMEALDPSLRALQVAEQGAAGVVGVANKEIALQTELTTLIGAAKSKYILTLKAETLETAKLALAKGVITKARYNEIAGIKKVIAANNAEVASLNRVTSASERAAIAGTNLNGVMRGVAGATGTLWLSYGAVIPLLAAFATVSAVIKGHKEALNFEYAVGYMVALGKATGDTTASLGRLRSGLLGIKGVAHGPNDLAVSLKALMKAGFTAADSMKELKTLSQLATIAEEDLAVTTAAVISQFRAWSVESVGAARGVNSMAEVANVLAAAALTTTLDIGELAKMMKYTPVLASQSAVSFVELTAALGTMSNMGVRGTTAATSLRTAIIQLQSPTSKTRRMLADLGLEVLLFTDKKELKSMSGMFDALAVSLKGLTDKEDRLRLLKSMFSIRAGSAGAIMLQQFNQAIEEGTFSFQSQVEMLQKTKDEIRFISDMYEGLTETTKTLWAETKAAYSRAAIKSIDVKPVRESVKILKDFAESGTIETITKGAGVLFTSTVQALGLISRALHLQDVVDTGGDLSFILTKVGDKVGALRAGVKGLTAETLMSLDATTLFTKQLVKGAEYTDDDLAAIGRLSSAYDSLGAAYVATEFDGKIQASSLKVKTLASEQEAFFTNMKIAGKTPENLAVFDSLKLKTEGARDELKKLRQDRAIALEDPLDWAIRESSRPVFAARNKKGVEETATVMKNAEDRRSLELAGWKLDRADVLAADKFSLEMLQLKYKNQAVSFEDYRQEKKDIGAKILRDDLEFHKKEWELAKELSAEATKVAGQQGAPSGAGSAARSAELRATTLEHTVKQKQLEISQSTKIYAEETRGIKVAEDENYAKVSFDIAKDRINKEKALNLDSISQQQQLLDERRGADLLSEGAYLVAKRSLQEAALNAERVAFVEQLSVLQTERARLLTGKGVEKTDSEIRKLDSAIKDVGDSLNTIEAKQYVLGNLVVLEDITKMKAFNDELEEIKRTAEAITEESDFDLGIKGLSSKRQGLEIARRGSRLERDERVSSLVEAEGMDDSTIKKINDIKLAYQEVDAARVSSYNKQQESSIDFFGGMEQGLNEYLECSQDIFGQSADWVSGSFDQMGSALAAFVATGKMDFKSLARSILADLQAMIIKQLLFLAIKTGLSALSGGDSATPPSDGAATVDNLMSSGNFSLVTPSAKGNVFSSPGLSAYSGTVVAQPTVFPFASGVGLMGEAGPEAILPLTDVGGELGVKSAPQRGKPYEIHIHNAPGTKAKTEESADGNRLDVMIEQLEQSMTSRMNRGAGMAPYFDSRYGRAY